MLTKRIKKFLFVSLYLFIYFDSIYLLFSFIVNFCIFFNYILCFTMHKKTKKNKILIKLKQNQKNKK
jgi:hypothetical protein